MRKPNGIKPLRLRHPLQLREPAAGFASRQAAANNRPMNVFLRDMAIPPRSIDKGRPEEVHQLALIGGADPDALARYTPRRERREHFHLVNGQILGYRKVSKNYFSFCPACIREDLATFPGRAWSRPWLRLQWIITHFRSCERHGLQLITTKPLRRRFEPFDFAETMERYLPELDALIEASPTMAPSPFQAWLLRRLDGECDQRSWLDQFPLYVAAEWCEALGVSALHPPKVMASTLTEIDIATAADEGYRVSYGGENAIRAFLQRRNDSERHTRGYWGLRDTYGPAYGLLQKTVEDPAFAPIRDLVRDFANSTIPLEPGLDVLGVVIDRPQVLSVRSAARASGAHDRSIRRMFERQGLAGEAISDGRRNHRVFAADAELHQAVAKLRGALSAPALIKALDIPRPHLAALMAIGALTTVNGSEKQANAKHRFAAGDVEAMLDRLVAGAVEVALPTPRQLPIIHARHVACTSTEYLLKLILDGKLAWKGLIAGKTGMDRYNALLVDVDEVIGLVRAEPPMTHLRRQDVPAFIPGLREESISFFVGEELLEETEEFSPEARRNVPVITRESATLFRTNFVTLGELHQTTGLHVKQIKLLLKSHGIVPEYQPGGDPNPKVYAYDRRAIAGLERGRSEFWAYDKAKALAAVKTLGS